MPAVEATGVREYGRGAGGSATRPAWLGPAGSKYRTEVRYANLKGNCTNKLDATLLEAQRAQCCLVVLSQTGLGHKNTQKINKHRVASTHRDNWKLQFALPARKHEQQEGVIVCSRGGWSATQVENIIPGRLVMVRGKDPGGNPIAIVVVQGFTNQGSKHADTALTQVDINQRKTKQRQIFGEMLRILRELPENDTVMVLGDFNSTLKPEHRSNGKIDKHWDGVFVAQVEKMKQLGCKSAEEQFMCPVKTVYTRFDSRTDRRSEEHNVYMAKLDHAFFRENARRAVTITGHDILSDSINTSDHTPISLTYTATNLSRRRFQTSNIPQTTRLFPQRMLDEDNRTDAVTANIDKWSAALDVALHADEEDKGMDFILRGLESSISAKLAGSPKEKRRRAPGITAAALKLKKKITQLRDLEIDAFNARKKEIGNEKERARLTDVIRSTKVQTKSLRKELRRVIREKERKSTTDLRRRIGSFGLCDRRFHKLIRADCGQDRTLISQIKDGQGEMRSGAELQEGMRSANQQYCDRLQHPMTDPTDSRKGDAAFVGQGSGLYEDVRGRLEHEQQPSLTFLQPTDREEVTSVIQAMNKNGSPGWSGETAALLLLMSDYAWTRYVQAINTLFATQHVTLATVASTVIHIAKKDNLTEEQKADLTYAWRPIAQQSVALKAASAVWVKRLEKAGLYKSLSQKGWKKGHSVTNAQSVLTNCFQAAKIEGRQCYSAFLDLRKAYDSVNFTVLEKVMQSLGLAQEDVGLAMNMLKMQSQQCMTSEGLSGTVRPKNGVAQGSAESPMLFAMLLEPLIRTLEQKYSHLGFKMGGTSIVIQCYADDMVVLSESAEGLQTLLNVVGDYCQYSGLAINVGKDKSATMHINASSSTPPFSIQDRYGASPRQLLFDLGAGSYRYLGLRVSEDGDWRDEMKYRLMQLRSNGSKILAHVVSLRQMRQVVLTYLQSATRCPGRFHVYNPKTCCEIDLIVRDFVKECMAFPTNVSEQMIHTPQALHGLGIARMAELQHKDCLLGAMKDLNSDDVQVRTCSRYVLDQLRSRGLKGSKIGNGLGYLLKVVDSTPALSFTYLGPHQDEIERDVETVWLRHTSAHTIKQTHIDALCNKGLNTMMKVRRWCLQEGRAAIARNFLQFMARYTGQYTGPPAPLDPLLSTVSGAHCMRPRSNWMTKYRDGKWPTWLTNVGRPSPQARVEQPQ